MEQRIKELLETINRGGYDQEITHTWYDGLLEEFILNYNESLIPVMKELIEAEKDFWYA